MAKKKSKKKKKKHQPTTKRELVFREHGEDYAVVVKKLGDRRLTVMLCDSQFETMGIIPGRFRRRCWFNDNDLCLVGHREFQNDKVDILYKYTPEEASALASLGEVPPAYNQHGKCGVTGENEEDDDGIDFDFSSI
jgi:translation initiation factor 1A